MLKNVDPILNADVLHALCSMGHGDEIVIVDVHYAGMKTAKYTDYGKLLYMESADTARAIQAVLSVTDPDPAVDHPIERMQVDNQLPDFQPECQKESQIVINQMTEQEYYHVPSVPRKEFYQRAKDAFAIVITGETRAWGCYIIRKGLHVTPDVTAGENNSKLEVYDWNKELGRQESKRSSNYEEQKSAE